ncbi:MAG: LPS export ABC transporter periplasmic protein LptC [Luteolibacter sp.]|uniref:LPS export ABC transporter periplasmic protein LptC n=1 Tax=Luteolibacter sp. TaxID=1962973 RepID=UPI003266E0D1
MHRLFTAFAIVAPAISLAGEKPDAPKKGWDNIFTLLPPGSELKDVMLPRYDADHKLTSVLKAQVMSLVNTQQIAGTTVAIEFFNPDNTQHGRIDLTTALIDKEKNLLSTKEPVKIKMDEGTATGSGIYYDLKTRKVILLGPATTVFHTPPK